MHRIAVLLTCYNRKTTTKKCLSTVYKINKELDIYCVDDNSSDGTYQMIQQDFPQVKLIKGNGSLFWNRGMILAWETAINSNIDYDYYFWLNDDLKLFHDAFNELISCENQFNDKAIICGLVAEQLSGKVIYGGFNQGKLIEVNGRCNEIQNMNGNFVCVPKSVIKKIGILDSHFHHDLGDVDYGLTAKENGIPVVTSRKIIGITDAKLKSKEKRNRKHGVNIVNRFKSLYSPLGSNPNITFYFINKHKGFFRAFSYYIYVHLINIIPDKIFKLISLNINQK